MQPISELIISEVIMAYNFKEIEKKWQKKWENEGTFNAKNDYTLKKWYGLIEFPYPSGQGLPVVLISLDQSKENPIDFNCSLK